MFWFLTVCKVGSVIAGIYIQSFVEAIIARMIYISSVERYQEYQTVIHDLLNSILATLEDGTKKQQDNRLLVAQYPFLELQYCLGKDGLQQGDNVCFKREYMKVLNNKGNAQDLSERPYFQKILSH